MNPLVLGRLALYWRSGAWCRPSEWVFGRRGCDAGCLVLDVGCVIVTWTRGYHTPVPTPEMKKKADLSLIVSRMMLPNSSEQVIEDQAVALMDLSSEDLEATFRRLTEERIK